MIVLWSGDALPSYRQTSASIKKKQSTPDKTKQPPSPLRIVPSTTPISLRADRPIFYAVPCWRKARPAGLAALRVTVPSDTNNGPTCRRKRAHHAEVIDGVLSPGQAAYYRHISLALHRGRRAASGVRPSTGLLRPAAPPPRRRVQALPGGARPRDAEPMRRCP
jgi:hypothetical protein